MTVNPQIKQSSVRTVEVQILGQRMVLKSENDPEHMERLAAYVKRKIDEIAAHGPVSSSKLAVLAALNIADDYFRILAESRAFKHQVAARSRRLLMELDGRGSEREASSERGTNE